MKNGPVSEINLSVLLIEYQEVWSGEELKDKQLNKS